MRKTVLLGLLDKGRVFYLDDRKYTVVSNIAPSAVSVRPAEGKLVTVGEKTFVRPSPTVLWSAGLEVQIEVRPKRKP